MHDLYSSPPQFREFRLWKVPSQQVQRLQPVQNTVARIVTRTRKREHITPVLKELHWLPVRKRIDHKIMSLAYKGYKGTEPEYLQKLIPRYIPARFLRSSSQPRLRIPSATEKHTKKQLGFRAFSNSAPALWNALPQNNQRSRFFCDVPQTSKNSPIS